MSVFVNEYLTSTYGIKQHDKCQCGGYRRVVHCPDCGSTQCYASSTVNMTAQYNGQTVVFRGFRCKLCGNRFTELDCVTACKAVTKFSQKAEREERKQIASSRPIPTKLIDFVNKERQKRGLPPMNTEGSVADEIDKKEEQS